MVITLVFIKVVILSVFYNKFAFCFIVSDFVYTKDAGSIPAGGTFIHGYCSNNVVKHDCYFL